MGILGMVERGSLPDCDVFMARGPRIPRMASYISGNSPGEGGRLPGSLANGNKATSFLFSAGPLR